MSLKLYEVLKSAKKVNSSIPIDTISQAMLINGEDIRPVVETVMAELNGGKLKLPNIAPVSSKVWIEFNTPNGENYKKYDGTLGALLQYEENDDDMVLSCKWKMTMLPFYMPRNTKNVIPLNGSWIHYISETGTNLYSNMSAELRKAGGKRETEIIDFHFINKETLKSVVSPSDLIISTYINCVACFSICTMHTKNVEIIERNGLTSIKEKNGRRQYNEFRYHTINVDTFRKKYVGGDTSPKGNKEIALHFVRGHFRNYTEEKPLFGKYSGTVWIPDMMRGNKEAGIVEKDYRVIPDRK